MNAQEETIRALREEAPKTLELREHPRAGGDVVLEWLDTRYLPRPLVSLELVDAAGDVWDDASIESAL